MVRCRFKHRASSGDGQLRSLVNVCPCSLVNVCQRQCDSSSQHMHGESQLCEHFTYVTGRFKFPFEVGTVSNSDNAGRLGNRIEMLIKMIKVAENNCCNVQFGRKSILEGWKPPTSAFENFNRTCTTHGSPGCQTLSGLEWFKDQRVDGSTSECARMILQFYFSMTETYVLGRKCPATSKLALHIRTGDVVRGAYNVSTGTYEPGQVHHKYWLYPTSYYIAALKSMRTRHPKASVLVFCESSTNPTCSFFEKLAILDPYISVISGRSLIKDLYDMLCADEIAVSRGTFRSIFDISPRNQVIHEYNPVMSKLKCRGKASFSYTIANQTLSTNYHNSMFPWRNTGYQRWLMNQFFDMTQDVCPKRAN